MSEQFHPHNGQLAPVLGVSAALAEWLGVDASGYVLATDDLRRWQLGGLLDQPRARSVGLIAEALIPLAAGVLAADRRSVLIAPAERLRGRLPAGCVAIAVQDDGWSQAAVEADHQLVAADIHLAGAMTRWALRATQSGESIVIHCASRAVPLIWSPSTQFDPDRWVMTGAGSITALVIGSAMAPVRTVMEQGQKLRAVAIADVGGGSEARQAIRTLIVGGQTVLVIRPPKGGEWVVDTITAMKKTVHDLVLKPDWRGVVDYTDQTHVQAIERLLKKIVR